MGRDSIRLRRGTLADWMRIDPVLDKAEVGIVFPNDPGELNPIGFKIGNGLDAFSALPFSDLGLIPKLTSDLENDGEDGSSPFATQQWVLDHEIEGLVDTVSINGGTKLLPDAEKNINLPIDKTTVGLSNVENLSPADMPISTATRNALNTLTNDLDTVESYIPGDTSDSNQLVNEDRLVSYSMPITTKYGASLQLDFNPANGVLTARLKDKDGNTLGPIQTVDFATEEYEAQIQSILALIPAQANPSNQLADKDFVNSSIATNTANFIGTFEDIPELNSYSGTITNNDYAFVTNSERDFNSVVDMNNYDKALLTNFDYGWVPNGNKFDLYRFNIITQEWSIRATNTAKDAVTLNVAYNRYKYTEETHSWEFEYTLNNSSFTAAQWAAINSNITAEKVQSYDHVVGDYVPKARKVAGNPLSADISAGVLLESLFEITEVAI